MPNFAPVFRYPQGSHHLLKHLLKLIPPHEVYVEVFGGAANLLFAKEPSRIEVYNDINSELVNFFRVLRDDEKWKILQEKLLLTPYAREEFNLAKEAMPEGLDEIERARRFYVQIEMSFAGRGQTFGYSRTKVKNPARTYFNKITNFEFFHERIKNVIIENLDFEDAIKRYDSPKTFFFCDPPYISHSVKSSRLNLEMTVADHERLLNAVLQVKGMVLLLGCNHPIYERLREHGWHIKRLRTILTLPNPHQMGNKRRYWIRYAWMNYRI